METELVSIVSSLCIGRREMHRIREKGALHLKRYLAWLSLMCLVWLTLSGCGARNDVADTESELSKSTLAEKSYRDYDEMDRLTVNGRTVTIVLPENQAIPYRWQLLCSDAGVPVEDETIADNSFRLSAGVSDAYRIFRLDFTAVPEATVELYLSRIHSEDAKEDYVEEIHYWISEKDGVLTGVEFNGN